MVMVAIFGLSKLDSLDGLTRLRTIVVSIEEVPLKRQGPVLGARGQYSTISKSESSSVTRFCRTTKGVVFDKKTDTKVTRLFSPKDHGNFRTKVGTKAKSTPRERQSLTELDVYGTTSHYQNKHDIICRFLMLSLAHVMCHCHKSNSACPTRHVSGMQPAGWRGLANGQVDSRDTQTKNAGDQKHSESI